MFIDLAKISIRAGKGGNGCVSFHREKFVAAGGPDGGDGGRGGNILFVVDDNLSTLSDFRYRRIYAAENGENGSSKNSSGKGGRSLTIRVPRGTLLRDANTGLILADLSGDEPFIAAHGGKGGWGNQHFATPTRQIPRFAKSGIPGMERELQLELKLLADVGLIGFPNVGKSSLISVVSEAKPNIANYPFTTLTPVLGVVRVGDSSSFVMADIPGLIEGAGKGAGLGHEFLRHVDRCRLLVHVVDVSGIEGRDPKQDFETINAELGTYSEQLAQRPHIVAANKADIAAPEQVAEFEAFVREKGYECFTISAATHSGVDALIATVAARLAQLPPVIRYEPEEIAQEEYTAPTQRDTVITNRDGVFFVEGAWLLNVIGSVNLEDSESLQYLQRVLKNSGIFEKLEQAGIHEGDTVSIYNAEFEYVR
ncbi:MAG: GTPase ObgE [Clostridia bacterium]|nr:GTPase ObgE [Clostridia bacterium]